MIKLGVIGCPHGKVTTVRKIVSKFRKEKVDAVILPGDLNKETKAKESIVKILKVITKLKKPIYQNSLRRRQTMVY